MKRSKNKQTTEDETTRVFFTQTWQIKNNVGDGVNTFDREEPDKKKRLKRDSFYFV